MKEIKTISIKCEGAGTLELAELTEFQGRLKNAVILIMIKLNYQ